MSNYPWISYDLTPKQREFYHYLSAEYQRQGKPPTRYTVNCGQCTASLETGDPLVAQGFISDHGGHIKFSYTVESQEGED